METIKEYNLIKTDKLVLKPVREIEWEADTNNARDIVELLCFHYDLADLTVERGYCVALDHNDKILGVCLVTSGGDHRCEMHPRTVLTFLLLIGAEKFYIVHNHPSNIMEISEDDEESTYSFVEMANNLSIKMMDGLIIGKCSWISILTKEEHSYYEEEDFSA